MQDSQKLRSLRRERRITTGLLPLMAGLLVVASRLKQHYPTLAGVQLFAEASLIGGLADWFAVVALFRHPLGVKLPHTAIVPRSKDRIGRELGRFVETNFLSAETIADWLKRRDIAGVLLRAGSRPQNIHHVLHGVADILTDAINATALSDFMKQAAQLITRPLTHIDAASLCARVLRWSIESGAENAVLNHGLTSLAAMLNANRKELRVKFGKRSPLTSRFFDTFVVNRFIDGIIDFIGEVAADTNHPARGEFADWLRQLAERLEADPELRQRVAEIQHTMLQSSLPESWGKDLCRIVADAVGAVDPDKLAEWIARACDAMRHDAPRVATFNQRLADAAGKVLNGRILRLSSLIEDVVRAWDTRELTEKLELEVGRDLQFIRLNGMIVGGLAGLVLHLLMRIAALN